MNKNVWFSGIFKYEKDQETGHPGEVEEVVNDQEPEEQEEELATEEEELQDEEETGHIEEPPHDDDEKDIEQEVEGIILYKKITL